jgi:hypothetical protein
MTFIESPDDDFGNTADIFLMLKYRFDLLHYADTLIAKLGIPKPDGKYCFEFCWQEWGHRARQLRGDQFRTLQNRCLARLLRPPVFGWPTNDQGDRFLPPTYYLAAAVTDASKTIEDADQILDKLLSFTAQNKQADLNNILQYSNVRSKGKQ